MVQKSNYFSKYTIYSLKNTLLQKCVLYNGYQSTIIQPYEHRINLKLSNKLE